MPDISMCQGTNCPQKEGCYRFKAEPNPYRQAYFTKPPFESGFKCTFFTPVEVKNDR